MKIKIADRLFLWFFIFCLLFGGTEAMAGQGAQDTAISFEEGKDILKEEIPNFVILDKDVLGGGKPSANALEAAQKMGIKTIIDLRTPVEGTEEEQKSVENLNMNYVNIPVIPSSLDDYEVEQLRTVLNDPQNTPAIIHCSTGGRVLKLWTLYQNKYSKKD